MPSSAAFSQRRNAARARPLPAPCCRPTRSQGEQLAEFDELIAVALNNPAPVQKAEQ